MASRIALVVALAWCLLCAAVFAGTTGQLTGTILDGDGTPLPGVTVTTESPAQIGGVRTTQTDVRGIFLFPRLAPGLYLVLMELDGFVSQEAQEVQVRLDRTTGLHVTMPLADFGDEVTVLEESPVVDPLQVSTGQTFTGEWMQESAPGRPQYWDLVTQAAGVEEREGGSFDPVVFGAHGTENVYLIDGLDTSDPLMNRVSSVVSPEAIQEINLHSAGYEAEFGRATGGVINLVTKSGGNAFHGSLDLRYGSNSWQERGDHFDPDEQDSQYGVGAASLGGPIVRDKAWFFAAYQQWDNKDTPAGAPTTRHNVGRDYLAKATWQFSPSWQMVGKLAADPLEISDLGSSPFVAPEATTRYEWAGQIVQGEVSGVLSSRALWTGQAGRLRKETNSFPESGDLVTAGHYNLDTGYMSQNELWQSYDESRRGQLRTDFTWFADEPAGSHELKGGLELHDMSFASTFCGTGTPSGERCTPGTWGVQYDDVDDGGGGSLPFDMWVIHAVGTSESTGLLWTAFAQDTWRVRPDLTLKLGVRWDQVGWENDVGEEVADLAKLQPRLGLAWDVRGNGRNLLRASWGQFMNPSGLLLPSWTAERQVQQEVWYSCSTHVVPDPVVCAAIAQDLGWGYRDDPDAWDPAGWVLLPGATFASEPSVIVDGLKATYDEQFVLGFERQLFRQTSLGLSYVDKVTRDAIDDTCSGNVPTPTEGGSCEFWVFSNLPEARREYRAWVLDFESRALEKLQVLASYVYSESKGSNWPAGYGNNDFDQYPFHFVNRFGLLPNQRHHVVKLNGYSVLPYEFGLAFSGRWASPFRWTVRDRRVDGMAYDAQFLEPRGSREGSASYQLDLQLSKAFRIAGTRLKLMGTIYNVFSSERPTEVCEFVDGCGLFETGEPMEWQRPRGYEVGLRVEF